MIIENAKKIAAGLGVTYGGVAVLVVALGVLNVLNSIPLVSSGLEVAGLYYIFLNRSKIPFYLKQVKDTFSKEDIEAVKALLTPESKDAQE